MLLQIRLLAQLAEFAGSRELTLVLADGAPPSLDAVARAAVDTAHRSARSDERFDRCLLTASGELRPSILVFVDGRQVVAGALDERALRPGQTVTFAPPI